MHLSVLNDWIRSFNPWLLTSILLLALLLTFGIFRDERPAEFVFKERCVWSVRGACMITQSKRIMNPEYAEWFKKHGKSYYKKEFEQYERTERTDDDFGNL